MDKSFQSSISEEQYDKLFRRLYDMENKLNRLADNMTIGVDQDLIFDSYRETRKNMLIIDKRMKRCETLLDHMIEILASIAKKSQ